MLLFDALLTGGAPAEPHPPEVSSDGTGAPVVFIERDPPTPRPRQTPHVVLVGDTVPVPSPAATQTPPDEPIAFIERNPPTPRRAQEVVLAENPTPSPVPTIAQATSDASVVFIEQPYDSRRTEEIVLFDDASPSPSPDSISCKHKPHPSCGVPICSNDCVRYPKDGYCNDGGEGALYDWCSLGSDCADCGYRYHAGPPPPPPPPPTLPPGNYELCTTEHRGKEPCLPLCIDDCRAFFGMSYSKDGICDDGGDASKSQVCPLGHDCSDCGVRSVMHKHKKHDKSSSIHSQSDPHDPHKDHLPRSPG